jgi:hypothetical protein
MAGCGRKSRSACRDADVDVALLQTRRATVRARLVSSSQRVVKPCERSSV